MEDILLVVLRVVGVLGCLGVVGFLATVVVFSCDGKPRVVGGDRQGRLLLMDMIDVEVVDSCLERLDEEDRRYDAEAARMMVQIKRLEDRMG